VDQDVYGDDFTDETFRVLKEKVEQYGDVSQSHAAVGVGGVG
jgi:hypothetical protein